MKCRNLVLEKQFEETLLLMSHWAHALVGALEILTRWAEFGGDVT